MVKCISFEDKDEEIVRKIYDKLVISNFNIERLSKIKQLKSCLSNEEIDYLNNYNN